MKKILVIVDAQNDFITGSLANEEAQKKVPNIVNKVNGLENDSIIILTQDTHYEDYLNTKEGKALPIIHCTADSDGWYICGDVINAVEAVEKSDKNIKAYSITKNTFGCLELIPLIKQLLSDSKEDFSIELCGFCTDICVVSNALILKAGFYNKADITVDASCCAGVTLEKHAAALETMKSCQINVINE